MQEHEVRQIATEAATKAATHAVHMTLEALGIDIQNPREVQQDLAMLRRLRRAREKGALALVWALATSITAGILSLAWSAITKGT